MKKIILLILTILLILFTYKTTYHSQNSILIITDGIASGLNNKQLTYNFADELINELPTTSITHLQNQNFRLTDLINNINNNQKYKNTTYQEVIKNNKYIILFLGNEDISFQINNNVKEEEIIKNITNDYNKLINTILKYNKNIIVINFYQRNSLNVAPINEYLNSLNINIIDISSLNNHTEFISYDDQIVISKKVNTFLEEKCKLDKNH